MLSQLNSTICNGSQPALQETVALFRVTPETVLDTFLSFNLQSQLCAPHSPSIQTSEDPGHPALQQLQPMAEESAWKLCALMSSPSWEWTPSVRPSCHCHQPTAFTQEKYGLTGITCTENTNKLKWWPESGWHWIYVIVKFWSAASAEMWPDLAKWVWSCDAGHGVIMLYFSFYFIFFCPWLCVMWSSQACSSGCERRSPPNLCSGQPRRKVTLNGGALLLMFPLFFRGWTEETRSSKTSVRILLKWGIKKNRNEKKYIKVNVRIALALQHTWLNSTSAFRCIKHSPAPRSAWIFGSRLILLWSQKNASTIHPTGPRCYKAPFPRCSQTQSQSFYCYVQMYYTVKLD